MQQRKTGAPRAAQSSPELIPSKSINYTDALKAMVVFKYETVIPLICPLKNTLLRVPFSFSLIMVWNLDFKTVHKAITTSPPRHPAPMNRKVDMFLTKLVDFIPDDSTALLTLCFDRFMK